MIAFVRRWILAVLLLIAGAALLFLLFSPFAELQEIRVQRTDTRVDIEAIQRSLLPLFHQRLFFISSREVIAIVHRAVPDAEDVSVDKEYPSTLAIRVTLKPLVARLQIEAPKGFGGSGSGLTTKPSPATTDYLSANGMYVSAPNTQTGAPLPTIKIVDWGVRPVPGTILFPDGLLERMTIAETQLRTQFNQPIIARSVYLRAREFHLASKQASFWFDMKSPLDEQLARFRTFLTAVNLAQVHFYVDLRLSGRVVWR